MITLFARPLFLSVAAALALSAAPAAAVVTISPPVVDRAAAAARPTVTEAIVGQRAEWAILAALVLGVAIMALQVRSGRQLPSVAA